nr:hypothetical protein [uncultured Roseateles sp.]
MLKKGKGRYVAAVLISLLLAGCATPLPTYKLQTDLKAPIIIRYAGYSSDAFFKIIRVEADAYTAQNIPVGIIWVQNGDDKGVTFLRLDEIANIDAVGKDYTFINSKSRMKFVTRTRQLLVCPPEAVPKTRSDCPQVRELVGTFLDERSGFQARGNQKLSVMDTYSYVGGNKYFRNIYSADEWTAYLEDEAQRAKAIQKSRQDEAVRQSAAALERAAQRKAESDARIVKLRGYAAGITVNCSSDQLVPRGTPVSGDVVFNCATIGKASIQELQSAGWTTAVISRLPSQQFDIVGDSIEMNATKAKAK